MHRACGGLQCKTTYHRHQLVALAASYTVATGVVYSKDCLGN